MKLFISSLIGIIIQFQVLYAQPVPEDQVPRLPEIAKNATGKAFDLNKVIAILEDKFSRIGSFAYTAKRGTPQDVMYSAVSWKEMGRSYYYDFLTVDKGYGPSNNHCIVAFNGERTAILREGGLIEISNGQHAILMPLVFPSPLDLYAFLKIDGKFLTINGLAPTSSLWHDLTSRIRYVGTEQFLNRDCIALRFSGSFCQIADQKADYDVYFDAHRLTPIGWRAFDRHGFLIEQLEVINFPPSAGEPYSRSSTFPSHSRVTQYQWAGTLSGPHGVIKYYKSVRDEYYYDVQTNRLSPEDLQIDSSLASGILDEDSKVLTRLPK